MVQKTGIVTILSTAPPEQAPGIAQTLVKEHLAACVNILPVRSVYRWLGRMCDDREDLMIIKTREERSGPVIARIKALHPSAVPEIIVLSVLRGNAPYLDWVLRETRYPLE